MKAIWSALVLSGLIPCSALPADTSAQLNKAWTAEYQELARQLGRLRSGGGVSRDRLRAEALDVQALVRAGDGDPLDIVLRRTGALLGHFQREEALGVRRLRGFETRLGKLTAAAKSTSDAGERRSVFMRACKLRREIALSNPLLSFDDIVCMLESPGEARIIEQARACWPGHSRGGGPVIIRDFKTVPRIERLLDGVAVASGRWKGRKLTGFFSGLELSFDASRLYFAATTDSNVWRIFVLDLARKRLAPLTDGPHDDFDPCELPSGRIAFVSTRRGGIGRCLLTPESLTYTLYSMEADGSDIIALSYHETNEWQPSVTHDGMLVYTRWDYVDRWWASAHHMWLSYPDGRDPRNYHGNYPLPRSAFPPGLQPEAYGRNRLDNGRVLRPDVEISFRAVPASPKYTATAVGHHQGFSGSLVMIDPRIPDDGMMSQVKRITPEYSFPEVEANALHAYGTAWPLSEDFYLCNFNLGLYLLDRFGNRVLLCDPGGGPHRLRDPFPFRPREKPPVIAVRTWQGKRAALPDHRKATIKVMNCYLGDMPLPKGTKVKWMRVIQVIPQLRRQINSEVIKYISFADESLGRMPLGVVPVEDDGSVYCEAPVGKALYFQLLDEKGMAVQSMRSATYVHPGEQMSCAGCHEDKWKAMAYGDSPKAFQRPPSRIVPEVDSGATPFNFYKLVKRPVFDKKCVPCHKKHPKAPDMTYASLARNDLLFGLPGERGMRMLGTGGSRTTPGRFGARVSGIVKSLQSREYHKDIRLGDDDWRRLTLWLDLNSNELGWIGNDMGQIDAQRHGEDVWPPIDVDPANPTGVENDIPVRSARVE